MRRIAHHTNGDAKPLMPVHENVLSGAATSVAPRFKRSSETNTHATLRPSCNHGLPKPEGRFCIRFSSAEAYYGNNFRIPLLVGASQPALSGIERVRAMPLACRGLPALPDLSIQTRRGAALSELIRIREPLQNWIVPRRSKVFEHPPKDWIQERIRMHHVKVERHQFTIQMQFRFIIERIAVIIF